MRKKNIIKTQEQLFSFFKDTSLKILKDTVISFGNNLKLGSNILFRGKINLGKNNMIDSNCMLENINLGNNNHIKMSSLISNSKISDNVIIGPFAYIREKTNIHKNCIIGAYAEVTRSTIQQKVYASHRTFIGDAKIGKEVIIGAGAVFCNYSFKNNSKNKSIIGKKSKIGSNSTIIAPCNMKPNTIVPALTKFKNK